MVADAVGHVELPEDAVQVDLHRRLPDAQLARDALVGQAAAHQPHDPVLGCRQPVAARRGRRRGGRGGGEGARHQLLVQPPFPACHRVDGVQQQLRRFLLEHDGAHPQADGLPGLELRDHAREQNGGRQLPVLHEPAQDGGTAQAGHVLIDQDHIRVVGAERREQLAAIAAGGHHFHFGVGGEQGEQLG
jgi:hypothetical protein